jgi:hypothetical protein
VRLVEERVQLHPLKVRPQELALRIPVYVGRTGTVLHEGHPDSMPPEQRPGTLHLYAERARTVSGRHEVVHPRKFALREAPRGRRIAQPWWRPYRAREASAI